MHNLSVASPLKAKTFGLIRKHFLKGVPLNSTSLKKKTIYFNAASVKYGVKSGIVPGEEMSK